MESKEQPSSRIFESETVSSIDTALEMILKNRDERGPDIFLYNSESEPHIEMVEVGGWPEQVVWTKNYKVDQSVFDELLEKGFIKLWMENQSSTRWTISAEGKKYLDTL